MFTYDVSKEYEINYERGPVFEGPPPEIPRTPEKRFLGRPVLSRLGISAGLLLNSSWVKGYAERGYDILTYKTVRSTKRPSYPHPNWVFVDGPEDSASPVYARAQPPGDLSEASSAVCFGMPSMGPEVWRADVARAKSTLRSGQVLIVSVVATPGEHPTRSSISADFARCAGWAAEAGADIVEANFSCPNVCSAEGTIYHDVEFSGAIAESIRREIGRVPLLIKVGQFSSGPQLEHFLLRLGSVISGLTLANAMTRPVLYRDGRPVFGDQYVKAGVVGRLVHKASLENVQVAKEVMRKHDLPLAVAAVGGASTLSDMADFFGAGADAVLMGSAPMYLPDLAVEAKRVHPEW